MTSTADAVDGTAAQLEVDGYMGGDRCGGREGVDVVGAGVDHCQELLDVGVVAQRLDAAGGGAGADGDQMADRRGCAGCVPRRRGC